MKKAAAAFKIKGYIKDRWRLLRDSEIEKASGVLEKRV